MTAQDSGNVPRTLLMDRSVPGRIGTTLPSLDVPPQELPPDDMLRGGLEMPEVSEGEIVRYFSQISQLNFSIDHNFYPLGSCTMKYNPKLNDEMAGLPGMAEIHPHQPPSTVQGALELMYELQRLLAEITGMAGASLAPMAGAEGELAGMLMTRAYHLARGDHKRTAVLVPDSAHGTNPASAAMAGFDVVTLPTDASGNTDLDALRGRRRGRHRRVHAHAAQHPRPLRHQHHRGDPHRPRRRRDPLRRRRQPQRTPRPGQARRPGLRRRTLEPAQDLHPAPRRRRPRVRSRHGEREAAALPALTGGRA